MTKLDLNKLEAEREAAAADKAELFDFYHKHWDELVAEVKRLSPAKVPVVAYTALTQFDVRQAEGRYLRHRETPLPPKIVELSTPGSLDSFRDTDGRTRQQIIDECSYAVACCIDHYCDEGLSREGVDAVRTALEDSLSVGVESGIAFRESICDSQYREFSDRIIWPTDWWVTERNPE